LDYLISAGFAGAVRDDLQVGDLFLADNFSDRKLLFDAQRILTDHKTYTAKLFTSTSIVDSITQRNEITRANGAAAVDMETEIIAQACATHGIRMLSVRVISDSLRNPFPAPPNVLFEIERQRINLLRLANYLIAHPAAVARLFRFRAQIADARQVLTDAIVAVVRELAI
jgi:nucleoside phosphorylase